MSSDARRYLSGSLPIDAVTPHASFVTLLDAEGLAPHWDTAAGSDMDIPEATTVLAIKYRNGVVMAGDRRATAGNVIAHRRVQKVFAADGYSAVAISGTAGMAIELIKLFQTELEHYEKIEGTRLSLEGKANYLARMVRNHLPLAFQGLAVVPLFCGYDESADEGKLYTFDVVGGRYEEQDYATTGSGGSEAKSFIKTVHDPQMDEPAVLRAAIEALIAAAEEDAATGGPDLRRGIYPNVVTVTAQGFVEIEEEQIAAIASDALEARP
ncbi:MAG: proteasome subunit beta [bacterium]|nr:proteasome subunit beta [bacterium]